MKIVERTWTRKTRETDLSPLPVRPLHCRSETIIMIVEVLKMNSDHVNDGKMQNDKHYNNDNGDCNGFLHTTTNANMNFSTLPI